LLLLKTDKYNSVTLSPNIHKVAVCILISNMTKKI